MTENETPPKTYRLRQSSPGLFLVTLLAIIYAGMGLFILLAVLHLMTIQNKLILVLCFLPVAIPAFYFARKASTREIAVTMDESGLKIKWIRQFFFSRKPDDEFGWDEIAEYVFEPDRQFDRLKFRLKDGYRFSIRHNNDDDGKDDFRQFTQDFIRKVGEINDADNNKGNDIRLGRNFFESTAGLVMALFVIAVIILVPVSLTLFPPAKPVQYGKLAVVSLAGLFFVARVFYARRNRKTCEKRMK